MRIARWIAPLAVALAFVATAHGAGSPEKGRQAYVIHGCWQCHGYDGQGSIAGSRIAPNPMPFEALSIFVRETKGAMPPYQKAVLPDADLADIYAYLQSVPKSADADRIPLLNLKKD